jgi:myo-inositol-1(or 4)-monophosphatase
LSSGDPEGFAAAAETIAREAGALVARRFHDAHDERTKGHAHNLVTEVDVAAEALIVQRLLDAFPDHSVIAEEGTEADRGTITWYVDPLDGTNNFAHGLPIFSVSLAATRGNQILAGVTFDPLRDELYRAAAGSGAWLNGQRLHVSERGALEESIVATGFPYDKGANPDNNLGPFVAVTPRVRGIRRMGSAAIDLAYVAAGRLEAYWERGTRAWDVAAGILLVREAGGRVTDYAGSEPRVDGGRFVASNALVHEELLRVLRSAPVSAG